MRVANGAGVGEQAAPREVVMERSAEPAAAGLGGLLVAAVSRAGPAAGRAAIRDAEAARERMRSFLAEADPARAIMLWLGRRDLVAAGRSHVALIARLGHDLAEIDAMLGRQVDAIVHHPAFQRLEASWRGLCYLVGQANDRAVRIRMLDVSWPALADDLRRAIDFDQSQLFQKVYSDEFDMPGGEPFGVLLGDYQLEGSSRADRGVDDIAALESVSRVAAAAFAPFITAAAPAMLELESFRDLERPIDIGAALRHARHARWRALRREEESRFLGLVLPRVLAREPYSPDEHRVDGFAYAEDVSAAAASGYLWANGVYCLGAVLIRAFESSGWLADIQGVEADSARGGLVTDLPAQGLATDAPGVGWKPVTEVVVTDRQEKQLSDLGFIALCQVKHTPWLAIYSTPSVQEPAAYRDALARANARLSTSLSNLLCVSRFAHYIKVLGREKIGSFSGPEECETFLARWLQDYVTSEEDPTIERQARSPLREARVNVSEVPGRPGAYRSEIYLRTLYQLEHIETAVRLVTELAEGAHAR